MSFDNNLPDPLMGPRWYAIHTLPRNEMLAVEHLTRQGFSTFLPRSLVTTRHARRFQTRITAHFQRYAFVEFDMLHHRWRSINGTIGVVSLVMGRDRPLPVPVGIVEELRDACDAEGIFEADRGFRPGDPVSLVSGPFTGATGTLVSLDAKGRVDMLLALMTGAIRLKVTRDRLRAVA